MHKIQLIILTIKGGPLLKSYFMKVDGKATVDLSKVKGLWVLNTTNFNASIAISNGGVGYYEDSVKPGHIFYCPLGTSWYNWSYSTVTCCPTTAETMLELNAHFGISGRECESAFANFLRRASSQPESLWMPAFGLSAIKGFKGIKGGDVVPWNKGFISAISNSTLYVSVAHYSRADSCILLKGGPRYEFGNWIPSDFVLESSSLPYIFEVGKLSGKSQIAFMQRYGHIPLPPYQGEAIKEYKEIDKVYDLIKSTPLPKDLPELVACSGTESCSKFPLLEKVEIVPRTGGTIGDGINFKDGSVMTKVAIQKEQVELLGTKGVECNYSIFKTKEEVEGMLKVDLAASGKYEGADISGELNVFLSSKLTDNSVIASLKASIDNSYTGTTETDLCEDSANYLKANGAKAFLDVYGTHYISGCRRSASLVILLKVQDKTKEDAAKAAIKLKVSLPEVGKVKAGMEAELKRLQEAHSIEVKMTAHGVVGVPINDSLEGIMKAMNEFMEFTKNPDNIAPSLFIASPFTSLPTFNADIKNVMQLQEAYKYGTFACGKYKYTGYMHNGVAFGEGVLISPDSSSIKGKFEHGKLNGNAFVTHKGVSYQIYFNNGRPELTEQRKSLTSSSH
eukprot:TRINITY_DN106011_c0_g1_i1.p1 TRINITY_DN106011_c0_g1~~TRINITY_DN106011_c0_g1_i1.p1  ORF type:complete len:621 (+),score=44.64 TRINITY_DN106011_c0_g1_i1:613-2475(+)